MNVKVCYACGLAHGEVRDNGKRTELRPYGPDGAPICFQCMTSDPEREREAKLQFGRAIERSSTSKTIAALTDDGPITMIVPQKRPV